MVKKKFQGKRLFIDFLNPVPFTPIYGCPIGGIGCGSIGRGFRGEFCRFQMVPGMYEHNIIDANQFTVCIRKKNKTVYQKVLSGSLKKRKTLKCWEWGDFSETGSYHALYPRSWTVYEIPSHQIKLVCKQVSPVFPHDYKDTSLPTAVFVWTIENNSDELVDVSIMFSFKNGCGNKEDRAGGSWTDSFEYEEEGCKVSGINIHQTLKGMGCTYGISATHDYDNSITRNIAFNPKGNGEDVWNDLKEDGRLTSEKNCSTKTEKGEEIACAVCVQNSIAPCSVKKAQFCLSWDMPVIHFGARQHQYARRYTRWFGKEGDAAPHLCCYASRKFTEWEDKICRWQNPILDNKSLPSWYKSALFNELYYASDGGSIWVDPLQSSDSNHVDSSHSHIKEFGKFAYLEGHEYRMYNTYDVHHYASFAFIQLWPQLQLSIQYDIAEAVLSEDRRPVTFLHSGAKGISKSKNAVPHDMGDPEDEPWKHVNGYVVFPTHDWKDLNMKFVLNVYRDYTSTKNKDYLQDMYPAMKGVMETAKKWDTDGDGIIDNAGYPDQTFDAWDVHGASAYCGGLWLAALKVMIEVNKILGLEASSEEYQKLIDQGAKSYEEKLWNGKYYNYDSSSGAYHDSIMADQLNGHWYLKASGLCDEEIFPKEHVKSALKTIYEFNVKKIAGGKMGAINGMRPNGDIDISSCQSEEFWVGVIYALAATMIQEGMVEEGFQTAYGTYHACWEWLGLAFQTPEAYMMNKHYRSLGYMRPLAIWSLQWALEKYQPDYFRSAGVQESEASSIIKEDK